MNRRGQGRPLTQQGVLNVRKLFWVAAVLVSAFVFGATSQTASAQSSPDVVVIDVARVFKEHIRFNQHMEVMKRDVEAYEGVVRRKREAIQEDAKEATLHEKGSPEYNRVEARAAKAMSDLQVEMGLKRKELMEQEARLYYNTYAEVTRLVASFADKHRIRLVLRYNGEGMNANDRQSVLAGVNNNVVFQRDLDISDAIIAEANRGAPAPGTANQGNNPGFVPPLPRN